jgi:Spy/CpxP family protein refolding chaperone
MDQPKHGVHVMIRNKLAAAALGLLVALPLTAQTGSAQGMHGFGDGPMAGMHGGDGSRFLMLLKSANLTQAQESQIQLILNSNKMQMKSLRQQLMSLHEKISDKLLGPGTVTASDLKPLVDQATHLEGTLNQSMTDTALSIRNVLTPAQVTKLAEVHDKLHSIHKQIQGIMGHGGDMPEDGDN